MFNQSIRNFRHLTDALNKGYCVDLIFFDFARAFDKVSHPKLIQKLEAYGIDKVLVRLIKTFLTDRKQRVMIGDNYSEWEEVTSSVSQGSVLGPLLFTIFKNDLPDKVKNPCKFYADDCKLLGKIEKDGDLQGIQEDINSLQSWSKTWQMSFNYEKCKVMHFGRNYAEHEYILE